MGVPEREDLSAGRSRSTSVIKKNTKGVGVSHFWMKHTAHAYQNLIRPVIIRVSLIVSPDLDAEHAEDTDAYVE